MRNRATLRPRRQGGRLRWWYRRYTQLHASHGAIAAMMAVPMLAWQAVLGENRDCRWPDPDGRAFDLAHGVDTAGIISLAALDVREPGWVHGFDYQPVEPMDFASVLAPFAIDYPRTTFIDLGAGKGRVVMLASALPFRQLVGVEIAPELARIASANLGRYTQGSATNWEIVRADAGDYRFPATPLVVFMYNPFTAPVMRRVIEQLRDVRERAAERVIVIYVRPELAELWTLAPGFEEVARTGRYHVYESVG
jgi:tRNA G46 methylase TrmB